MERVESIGVSAAPTLDLLAIATAGSPDEVQSRTQLALEWSERKPKFFFDLTPDDLARMSNATEFEVLRMQCLMEIGRRSANVNKEPESYVSGFPDVERRFLYLRDEPKEHFCAAYLNSKNGIIAIRTVHMGTVNMSLVGAREVFREAVRVGAASLIVVHNHPSGDPSPSPEDIEVTKKLQNAGDLLDVPLLDHVIIGKPNNFSFRQRGLL